MLNTVAPNVTLSRTNMPPDSQLSPNFAQTMLQQQLSPGQRNTAFSPQSNPGSVYLNFLQNHKLSNKINIHPTLYHNKFVGYGPQYSQGGP